MTERKFIPTRGSRDLWAKIKPLARQMRTAQTPAEMALWERLRGKQVGGVKFRRQHPIDRFIVDFYCQEAQLVIEVDGSIHEYTQEEDALRQEFLESLGLRVIRFSNADVLTTIDGVVETIAAALHPHPPPCEAGRGSKMRGIKVPHCAAGRDLGWG